MSITLYHNPRCSKSRATKELLEKRGVAFEEIHYLKTPPSKETLQAILKMLGFSARELMRTKEEVYKELGLQEVTQEEKLIEAMVQHPKLIERPIVIKEDRAVIGRPIENVEALLEA